jgi:hypothetical protein
MNDSIKSLVRHILSADQLPEVVGAVITLVAAAWGILSKKKATPPAQ